MDEKNLFKYFAIQSKAQWIAKIEKDLNGKDFNSLLSKTAEGITIAPAYTEEDVQPKAQPFRENLKWDTTQEILVIEVKAANREALAHLERGATSLLFYLQGTENLAELLKDIRIEYIRLNLVVAEGAPKVAQQLARLMETRGLKANELVGSINHDPLENLARTGNWFQNEEEDIDSLKELHRYCPSGYKSLCLNLNHFANAGATHSQQLGISLALAYETHYRLQTDSLHDFWVNFAIGSDYFGEIAKLRAFRRLWDHLSQELGLKPSQPTLYCETALRNKTIKDAYNNMVRTTSEAMAAVIGGADEVSIKGFNHTFAEPTPFGERIARNQSSILQHESHLDAVKDLAQGSYFIEELTEKLAEKAWQFFVKIEAEGGFVEAMRKGWLQDWVEGAAEKEQKAFDQGEKVLIGANQYAKEDEDLKAIIKKGHFFSESKKETAVKKLIAKRLSEGVEK